MGRIPASRVAIPQLDLAGGEVVVELFEGLQRVTSASCCTMLDYYEERPGTR
jgi:hypothetical protein